MDLKERHTGIGPTALRLQNLLGQREGLLADPSVDQRTGSLVGFLVGGGLVTARGGVGKTLEDRAPTTLRASISALLVVAGSPIGMSTATTVAVGTAMRRSRKLAASTARLKTPCWSTTPTQPALQPSTPTTSPWCS
jgi:hypothetical protein